MRLCDDKHDALVYDDRRDDCPACDAMAVAADLAARLATAENVRDVLSDRVAAADERAEDLEAQLASAKDGRIDAERELARQRMTSRA
jgi:hypothetical protein